MSIKRIFNHTTFILVCAFNVSAIAAPKNPLTSIDLKSYLEKLSEDYSIEKMDYDNSGNPDMFVVFKKADSGRIMVRQMFDFNKDGKIDIVNHYQKGKKIKTESDLDYDGKVDTITEFDVNTEQVYKKTLVENGNLLWKYWHNNELRRKEADRNGDGDPDMWVHYRNGKIVKTEIDVNFDGKNIRIEGDLTKSK